MQRLHSILDRTSNSTRRPLAAVLLAAIVAAICFGPQPLSGAQDTSVKKSEPATENKPESVNLKFGKLNEHLLFYSSFDGTTDAEFAKGDKRLFTANNRRETGKAKPGLHDETVSIAEGKGVSGDALQFTAKKRKLTYYKGVKNIGYDEKSFSGSISFWLQLDPAKDLKPGFCDPIQITDVTYNDAAIWVDFTKTNPRDFRLGIIGDLEKWNPEQKSPDNNPEFEKRLIPAKQPSFTRDKWSHVVINFDGLNSDTAKTQLYLDGELQGELDMKDPFTWEVEKSRIMLGLSYIGLFDEFAIFDRPLSTAEIKQVHEAEGGKLDE